MKNSQRGAKRFFHFHLFGLLLSFLMWLPAEATADVRESIVKIYSIHNSPDYFNPWSMMGPRSSTGSGCVIEGNRILTNAHVVSDRTFVQVRRYGDSKRYEANVLGVSHQLDLALLEVKDEAFFEDARPIKLGKLPRPQTEVLVYGFPLGGDTLSTTRGVVSRIEHINYTHSSGYYLAGQIDAAINPGNSGGPVLVDERVVGVVMQALNVNKGENIGYMVPVSVLKQYLKDLEDGSHDGIPTLNLGLQKLENPDLRAAFKVPTEASGVLVTKVTVNSPVKEELQVGDVITSVDGHEIADDGTVEFRDKERTSHLHYVQSKQIGDSVELRYLRNGESKKAEVTLGLPYRDSFLVPMERYDILPTYYIYGGLLFTPLTKNLLRRWGANWYQRAPRALVAALKPNYLERIGEQKILMLKVLASELTEGYLDYKFLELDKVDGEPILNMEELVEKLEATPSNDANPFVYFTDSNGLQIVLDRKRAKELNAQVLKTYRIAADRSANLPPPVSP